MRPKTRLHLVEIHDLACCPRAIRDAARNYDWNIGELKSTAGPIPLTYLVGVPRNCNGGSRNPTLP